MRKAKRMKYLIMLTLSLILTACGADEPEKREVIKTGEHSWVIRDGFSEVFYERDPETGVLTVTDRKGGTVVKYDREGNIIDAEGLD